MLIDVLFLDEQSKDAVEAWEETERGREPSRLQRYRHDDTLINGIRRNSYKVLVKIVTEISINLKPDHVKIVTILQ